MRECPADFFDDDEEPTPKQRVIAGTFADMARRANVLIGEPGSGKSWVWARFVRWIYRNDEGVRQAIDEGLLR